MNAQEVLAQLAAMATEQTKKTFSRHGAPDPFFGVKVGDMKLIQKKVKKDHQLSLDLYDTGNSDAMYLAGLIADEKKISKAELQHWAEKATWYMLGEYTVAWVAAESAFGLELAREWIESPNEIIATAGWSTLGSLVAIKPDAELDHEYFHSLLKRVEKEIHTAPNRVRYVMNSFVIAVGCYVPVLTSAAKAAARKIGKVEVNMGDTACKVPAAEDYINKVEEMGRLGQKKKMARC
jgi:3-methyladenine DNA glycosylase AlkD